jgi:uncharacterized protein YjbJ (UPF0337 family)
MANPSGTRSSQEHGTNFGQSASELKGKAQEAAGSAADRAREAASSVADKARQAASTVSEKASEAASAAGQKADDAACAVGNRMQSLAGTIREKMPHEGMMGSATSTVADTLERGGRYLQEEGFSGMAEDLTTLIRRHPIPALLVALGLGFIIARSTTRS